MEYFCERINVIKQKRKKHCLKHCLMAGNFRLLFDASFRMLSVISWYFVICYHWCFVIHFLLIWCAIPKLVGITIFFHTHSLGPCLVFVCALVFAFAVCSQCSSYSVLQKMEKWKIEFIDNNNRSLSPCLMFSQYESVEFVFNISHYFIQIQFLFSFVRVTNVLYSFCHFSIV